MRGVVKQSLAVAGAKCINTIDAFEDIPQVLFGVSKRQEPPPAKLVYGQAPSSILLKTDRR